MAILTTNNLKMVFRTAGGKNFTLTIPMPRVDVTVQEVETVMDLILSKNILVTPSGDLTGKQDIRIINTTVNDLYTPPQV